MPGAQPAINTRDGCVCVFEYLSVCSGKTSSASLFPAFLCFSQLRFQHLVFSPFEWALSLCCVLRNLQRR